MKSLPVALTIAGSDSGAGAGIQADLLTFAANGVFGTTAITCLTAQNPDSVSAVHAAPGTIVREQAEQVARYFEVGAVKTGMLFNVEIIDAVAGFLNAYPDIPYVLDPVMISTSGAKLLGDEALAAIRAKLVPRAALVTPNLDEAALFLGRRPAGLPLTQKDDALELAKKLGVPVLLKGGHAPSAFELVDAYATPKGECVILDGARREDIDTHGSGCTLAAAITAHLARGLPLVDAIHAAHAYLQRGIHSGLTVRDKIFIAHFPGATTTPSAPVQKKSASPLAVKKPVALAAPRPDPVTAQALPYTAPSPKPAHRVPMPFGVPQDASDAVKAEQKRFFKNIAFTLIGMAVFHSIITPIPPLIWLAVAVYFIYRYKKIGEAE